jgi:hypothetical protein
VLLLAIGEWIPAYIFFAVAFVVAVGGVTGLGMYVVFADMRNRRQTAARHGADVHEEDSTLNRAPDSLKSGRG